MATTDPRPTPSPAAEASAQPEVYEQRRVDTAYVPALIVLVVALSFLAWFFRGVPVLPGHYILLSIMLFTAGAFGVLIRRNAIFLFMCIELMLNAVNLAFVAFARMHGSMEGQVIVLFVMIVAAAEVAIGLAIVVSIHRRRLSANVDDVSELRW